jgi:hypothetical protein
VETSFIAIKQWENNNIQTLSLRRRTPQDHSQRSGYVERTTEWSFMIFPYLMFAADCCSNFSCCHTAIRTVLPRVSPIRPDTASESDRPRPWQPRGWFGPSQWSHLTGEDPQSRRRHPGKLRATRRVRHLSRKSWKIHVFLFYDRTPAEIEISPTRMRTKELQLNRFTVTWGNFCWFSTSFSKNRRCEKQTAPRAWTMMSRQLLRLSSWNHSHCDINSTNTIFCIVLI